MGIGQAFTALGVISALGIYIALRQRAKHIERQRFLSLKGTYEKALEAVLRRTDNIECTKICLEVGRDFYRQILVGHDSIGYTGKDQLNTIMQISQSEELLDKKIMSDVLDRFKLMHQLALVHGEDPPPPLDLKKLALAFDQAKRGGEQPAATPDSSSNESSSSSAA